MKFNVKLVIRHPMIAPSGNIDVNDPKFYDLSGSYQLFFKEISSEYEFIITNKYPFMNAPIAIPIENKCIYLLLFFIINFLIIIYLKFLNYFLNKNCQ